MTTAPPHANAVYPTHGASWADLCATAGIQPNTQGMVKIADYPGRDPTTGAPLVHLVEPGSSRAYGLSELAGIKEAEDSPMVNGIRDLLASVKPKPDTLYLVNSAIVAGERTGYNARGDWFTREGLKREPAGWRDLPMTIDALDRRRKLAAETVEVPGWGRLAWGYTTFLNAHRFQHHINLDPQKARGFTLGAFWDDRMDRVILVTELVRTLCEHNGRDAVSIYDRIKAGEYPDTSMACRVPYDICSICGFAARVPRDYCEHARTSLKKVLPDGRKVGVFTQYPSFFDDSFVFVGAERAAKMMMLMSASGGTDYTRDAYRPSAFGPPVRVTVNALTRAVDRVKEAEAQRKQADNGLITGGMLADTSNANLSARENLYNPRIAEVLASVLHPPAKKDIGISEQLAEITRGVAAQSTEAAVRRYVARRLSWLAAARDGRRTQEETRSWETQARDYIRSKHGLSSSDLDAAEARVLSALNSRYVERAEDPTAAPVSTPFTSTAGVTKLASCALDLPLASAIKRSDIIKRLPPAHAGTADTIALLDDKMKPLPQEALDALADIGPNGPQIALRIGILLSPAEWQYTQVRPRFPDIARKILSCGPTFDAPQFELDTDTHPHEIPSALEDLGDGHEPDTALHRLLRVILPAIAGRSLLGGGLQRLRTQERLTDGLPPIRHPLFSRESYLGTNTERTLDEPMSRSGYSSYRLGALADLAELRYLWGNRLGDHPSVPDWRHLFT